MENYEWAKEMNCAVTVCDAEGVIIYMNDKSRETYKKEGDLILYLCQLEQHLCRRGRADPRVRSRL